jgi:hypothetical protein
MDEKMIKQMAVMTDAVQPFCGEKIVAAMTCSHSGSMARTLFSKIFLGGFGAAWRTSGLPNPVMIAVGAENIYAFDYRPRGFHFKIKKEVARWAKKDVTIEAENGDRMVTFSITPAAQEKIPLEIPVFMGGKELADFFIASLRR